MLHITKQDTKDFYLTLTEKTTISNPTYLFSLKSRQTDTFKNFILPDISNFKQRYNKFEFTEGDTDATTLDVGEHLYTIYAQISPNNTNPNNADEVVETGIFKVLPLINEELFYVVE
jgi:hypothetical protein